MSDHIKSQDLCERCVFSFNRICDSVDCRFCKMLGSSGVCKCCTIQEYTPCPYFVEDTEK